MRGSLILVAALVAAASPFAAGADNWPSFRGPSARGVATGDGHLPQTWNVDDGRNVRWHTPIPGYSHSSPIVWGDRIFLVTSVSDDPRADGRRDDTENLAVSDDDAIHEWRLYALDRATGQVRWQRLAHRGAPRVSRHEKSSHANPTPATDGRHVVALFNSEGLYAYDLDGRELWHQDLGRLDPGYWGYPERPWGHASSPVIVDDRVIVQVDRVEKSFLAAFRLDDGAELWRVPRNELATWSTPTLVEYDGRRQIVTQGGNFVRAYDPSDGHELWRFADHAEVKVPTPFFADGKILVTGGNPAGRPIFAIDPAARGDVSVRDGAPNAAVLWEVASGGPYTSTPLAYGPLLYVTRDNGALSTYRLRDGSLVYRQRVGGGFSASAVAGDDKLFLASEDGEVYVVRPGESYQLLATNDLKEPLFATPAISGDLLVVRTRTQVYGIGTTR